MTVSDQGERTTSASRAGFAARLGGFLGIPMLSALAPFATLPIISRIAGEAGWGAVSTAQAIGTLGSVVALFGWGIYGPPAVAQCPHPAQQQRLYRDSLVVRCLALVVVIPLALAATWWVVDPAWRVDSLLIAATFAATAIQPTWYCIGLGQPGLMARYDVIPRFVAIVAAIPLLLLTGQVWPYPVLVLSTMIVATLLFSRRVLRDFDRRSAPIGSLPARFRESVAAAGVDTASNAYGVVPVPVATASLSHAAGSAFASADRLFRVGITVVVGALGNAFQAWVLDLGATDHRRRQWIAIAAHAVVGVVGMAVLAVTGPWITGLVFGDDVAAHVVPSLWYGVAFLAMSLSTPLIRNLLIPAGQGRLVFGSTLASSLVGLALMAFGAVRGDAALIAAGLGVSQVLLALLLVRPALARMPKPSSAANVPNTAGDERADGLSGPGSA